MLNHYTSILNKNNLVRVLAKWERYETVTEWGYSWIGGYLVEMTDGKLWHMHGWRVSDAPWMNQAWVYAEEVDEYSIPDAQGKWKDYTVEVER